MDKNEMLQEKLLKAKIANEKLQKRLAEEQLIEIERKRQKQIEATESRRKMSKHAACAGYWVLVILIGLAILYTILLGANLLFGENNWAGILAWVATYFLIRLEIKMIRGN